MLLDSFSNSPFSNFILHLLEKSPTYNLDDGSLVIHTYGSSLINRYTIDGWREM
jgi:hypothetical protein